MSKKFIKKFYSSNLENRLRLAAGTNSSLHFCLRRTLLSCRMIGLFPVIGLFRNDTKYLRIQWKSAYTIYYLLSTTGQILLSLASFGLLIQQFALSNITNCMFYMSGLISTLLMLRVAFRWQKTVSIVEAIEKSLPPISSNTPFLCNLSMALVLTGALVEHLSSVIFGLQMAKHCNPEGSTLETFFLLGNPWVFNVVPYNELSAFFTMIFNFQSTFLWSYNDLLVMVFSLYLADHFIVLYKIIKRVKNRKGVDWNGLQIQYRNIVKIINIINLDINYHLLLCFAGNLVWICMQLYNSLNKTQSGHYHICANSNLEQVLNGLVHRFYFTYSFLFLLVRTLCMSLMAARVHSTSLLPLLSLYEVPSSLYNIEVKRFADQVTYSEVALSGMGFFSVTRKMILAILGTIITYELVLLQFNPGTSVTTKVSDKS